MKYSLLLLAALVFAGFLAPQTHALSAKEFLISSITKIKNEVPIKAWYALGAVGVAAAGFYAYTLLKKYQRTYQIGDEKIIAPQGAQVEFSDNDKTPYAHKRSYFFSLINQKVAAFVPAHGQKRSNILQIFHNAYEKNPGVRIIMYSNDEINQLPQVTMAKEHLLVKLPDAKALGRVDYIFTCGAKK